MPRSSSTAAATASGPSRPPRRWWALNAAAMQRVQRLLRGQGHATDDGQREQHRKPAQAPSIRASSSAVSRSSSAEAVTRLAPARSPGASRVMSDRLRLDGDGGPVGGRARRVGDGELQQVRVPVVHDPVLRPGQPRREPAAHRAAAAAEVVDHEAAGRGEVPREALGELGRARRRVGRLAQDEPLRADPDGLRDHRAAPARPSRSSRRDALALTTPARTSATADAVAAHGRSVARRSRAARRSRSRSSASSSQARSAAPRAAGSPGGTSSPGRVPSSPMPERLGHSADLGGEDRHAAGQRLGDDHAVRLGVRGEHEQVRGGVRAVELLAGARSREAHPVAQPELPRAPAHAIGERRVADQAAHARRSATTGPSPSRARRAARRGPCPASAPRRRAASRRPRSPARGAAASTPGSATCTRSAGSAYSSASRRRVHALVVTTAAAAARTRARALAPRRPRLGGRWPSGMCTSTTCRSRSACGTSTSGAADAISPSSSTTAPSGIRRMACVERGVRRRTACSCTAQPSAASPRQTRRS